MSLARVFGVECIGVLTKVKCQRSSLFRWQRRPLLLKTSQWCTMYVLSMFFPICEVGPTIIVLGCVAAIYVILAVSCSSTFLDTIFSRNPLPPRIYTKKHRQLLLLGQLANWSFSIHRLLYRRCFLLSQWLSSDVVKTFHSLRHLSYLVNSKDLEHRLLVQLSRRRLLAKTKIKMMLLSIDVLLLLLLLM